MLAAQTAEKEAVMHFSYRLDRVENHFVAECVEVDAAGEGETAAEAVLQLRELLSKKMEPQAVAPPSTGGPVEIELVESGTTRGVPNATGGATSPDLVSN